LSYALPVEVISVMTFVYFAIVLVATGMGLYLGYLAIRPLRKYLRS
jgi:hypothetical protein